MIVLLLCILLLTIITLFRLLVVPFKLVPPGPCGIPFVGVYYRLGDVSLAYLKLNNWLKEYKSNIISFYVGSDPVVVLGDHKVIREALVKHGNVFSGRPDYELAKSDAFFGQGIVMTNGAVFHEQRRFAIHTLRDFGLGKPILEGTVREECRFLVDNLSKTNQQAIDVQFLLNGAVANVICSMVFGQRFNYDDEEYKDLLDILNWRISRRQLNFLSPIIHFRFYRWLRFFPGMGRLRAYFAKNENTIKLLKNFMHCQIEEHRSEFDVNNEPTDYVSAFLRAQALNQGDYFDDDQLVANLVSMLGAGTETTATTLRWAILYMAMHGDIQEKVFQEISHNIGTDTMPEMKDRSILPFTEATILEIQRLSNLTPMSIARRTTEDTQISGYHISKGTLVIPLLWAVHYDDQNFPNPKHFNPERFLENGEKENNLDAFMPFSIGKRACLGESLAKMELFLFFSSMLQRFKFKFPINYQVDIGGTSGVTLSPKAFDVIVSPRT